MAVVASTHLLPASPTCLVSIPSRQQTTSLVRARRRKSPPAQHVSVTTFAAHHTSSKPHHIPSRQKRHPPRCLPSAARQYRRHLSTSRPCSARVQTTPPQGAALRNPELEHEKWLEGELKPKHLTRPLGLYHPPRAGENTGRDERGYLQRIREWWTWESYVKRRQRIVDDATIYTPLHDLGNIGKHYQGKSILSPSTPFRATHALYFPNLEGLTLSATRHAVRRADSGCRDTTSAFRNRITLVRLSSANLGSQQFASFTDPKHNPALHTFLGALKEKAAAGSVPPNAVPQFATVHAEDSWIKSFTVRMLFPWLRGQYPSEEHERFFLVRRGISWEVRDAIALWNMKVGYVYLLDGQCRVRWAGNGFAREEEKASLVGAVKRLVAEAQGVSANVMKRASVGVRREEPGVVKPVGRTEAVQQQQRVQTDRGSKTPGVSDGTPVAQKKEGQKAAAGGS
ncbi:MAG: Mitochondrial ATPase complex subunit atp10 [Alyxoria varia]|nr:MAG: Mitochondrial ATPase complex subunit atp10 [Alyxoria varia]